MPHKGPNVGEVHAQPNRPSRGILLAQIQPQVKSMYCIVRPSSYNNEAKVGLFGGLVWLVVCSAPSIAFSRLARNESTGPQRPKPHT